MRRLTLILSDLYLPEELGRGVDLQARTLPNLEWLLRFADSPQPLRDWRSWLVGQVGPASSARNLESTWLATPVALEARLDHVRLLDRGLLRLDETDRSRACEEFAS